MIESVSIDGRQGSRWRTKLVGSSGLAQLRRFSGNRNINTALHLDMSSQMNMYTM